MQFASVVVAALLAQSGNSPVAPAKPASADEPAAARSLTTLVAETPDELSRQLLDVKRIFVDRLTGGETALQMRDLVIGTLQASRLFILTENPERADAFLRGAAEDLIYTDSFQSSDGINAHIGGGETDSSSSSTRFNGAGGAASRRTGRNLSATIGEHESVSEKKRKHEAMATVRIVNKEGDVIWSTTQESGGAKFRGASVDVADKITRQLTEDVARLRRAATIPRH